MTLRAILETAVGLLLTAVLALVGAGLMSLESGWQSAFLADAPRLIGLNFLFGSVLWAILLLVGNLANRGRTSGRKFLTNTVSLLIAAVINVVVWSVIGFIEGGWGVFLVVLAVLASVIVLVAGALALLLTHFVFFRGGKTAATSVADEVTLSS